MIVALAGHVDHGKTALIRALTGIETDRLPEEQRRGMTIDLGFAYLHSADAPSIGFVDVPGHERFLANMLAGVLGTDCVLLVIAADDGPMPQTLEHLAILTLTGISDIDIVITKTDAVTPARVDQVAAEAATLLQHAGQAPTRIHRVSSHTGDGIAALRAHLYERARAQVRRDSTGGFRLSIDRRFSIHGTGLVVTGTAVSGQASVGDTLVLSPPRLTARIRTIHVQDRPAETARTGDRCALAISGQRVDLQRVHRGDWLLAPELHAPTTVLDLHLRVADGQRLRHGRDVQLHLGAARVGARPLVLAGGDMGANSDGFVRALLARPVGALHGDRVALRDEATGRILAGGRVVDPFPSARRVPRPHLLARLEALRETDPRAALARLLEVDGSAELSAFARARNLPETTLADGLPARVIGAAGQRVIIATIAAKAWRALLLDSLAAWHAEHPDSAGPNRAVLLRNAMAREESRRSDQAVAAAALADLLAEGAIRRTGALLRLPDHKPRLADADEALWARLHPILADAALRPPRVRELMELLGLSLENTQAVLERLARFGRLIRVAPNRFFLPETVSELTDMATTLAAAHDGFTAAEFNKRSGIGRNLTIEVLEYLDAAGATQRLGEVRHMAQAAL